MGLKIAIVGLPNVGKSTIFNALTRSKKAQAANYPFCTIDPNVGVVELPDERLEKLAETLHSEKIIPATIEFVDVAGLVKGANEGEGLGNQFLSHIRECDAIAQVVRVFDDPNVIHVHGTIDPKFDREIIESELLLKDLQTVEKRLQQANAEAKSGDRDKKNYASLLTQISLQFSQGKLGCDLSLSVEEKHSLQDLHLLTMKPNLYIINIPESELGSISKEKYAQALGISNQDKIIPICAKLEAELADLSKSEAQEYLKSLNIPESGLNNLIRCAYATLDLITYFTSGPKETRAWTIHRNTYAPQAAGVIHTDFEKGFIKAEVTKWQDFVREGGDVKAKEKGLTRLEGKEYLVQDGDTIFFKFSS